jgi:hypothetical protein
MPPSFPKNLFRLKRRDAMLLGTALFVVIAVLDWATANAHAFSAFYLFPILLVAWNCGRGGLLFAVAAVATVVATGSATEVPRDKPIHLVAHASVLVECDRGPAHVSVTQALQPGATHRASTP